MQQHRRAQHAEYRLHAQKQRHGDGVAVALRGKLERIGDRAREDAEIQNRDDVVAKLGERRLLHGEHADETDDRRHDELRAVELRRRTEADIVIRRENVHRIDPRAQKDQRVARRDREAFLHADEIEPRESQQDADPETRRDSLMQEHHAEERHEQDIQRRQKARLARFNVRNGVLLHDGRCDHKHAAHGAADGDLFRVALLPLLRLFPPVGYKKKNSQRQSCEHTAIEVEGDGSDMSCGHALKGKRGSPDKRRRQSRQRRFQAQSFFHNVYIIWVLRRIGKALSEKTLVQKNRLKHWEMCATF